MDITDIIGKLPYRMAFAGGWIDQPFVSQHDPAPPGSMVVVALEPAVAFMDRCGMGTSTRRVAAQLWGDTCPTRSCRSWCANCTRPKTQDGPSHRVRRT